MIINSKAGRPRKQIDMEEVLKRLEVGATKTSIAKALGVNIKTLNRCIKEYEPDPKPQPIDSAKRERERLERYFMRGGN